MKALGRMKMRIEGGVEVTSSISGEERETGLTPQLGDLLSAGVGYAVNWRPQYTSRCAVSRVALSKLIRIERS